MEVAAEDVKAGMGLKTWFGTHTVIRISPYTGPFDFVLNILEFSNGTKMSNEKNAMYKSA
ncbi:hypothetical protein [Paenibacillus elgii]|uniref:hypothetical protein n=1 Tax=Paenibacillus elgii TaxID=189691 RepID=UPI00203CDE6E|nr:hypothetical protein [Paenibacillus elgii]MCM3272614.1 hypothetical protein [Paenibacillus elgii]